MSTELITIEVKKHPDRPRTVEVVFIPPSDELLADFAHTVCRELGCEDGCPELEEGLVAFLRVWTGTYARELTASHSGEIDSRIE